MKIVITSSGDNKNSLFDKRFGRAAFFCLYDKDSGETVFFENENANSNNGAGTKAAAKMIELKVQKIISGDFGPKAKELLDKLDVQMIIIQEDNITVNDVISKLKL